MPVLLLRVYFLFVQSFSVVCVARRGVACRVWYRKCKYSTGLLVLNVCVFVQYDQPQIIMQLSYVPVLLVMVSFGGIGAHYCCDFNSLSQWHLAYNVCGCLHWCYSSVLQLHAFPYTYSWYFITLFILDKYNYMLDISFIDKALSMKSLMMIGLDILPYSLCDAGSFCGKYMPQSSWRSREEGEQHTQGWRPPRPLSQFAWHVTKMEQHSFVEGGFILCTSPGLHPSMS